MSYDNFKKAIESELTKYYETQGKEVYFEYNFVEKVNIRREGLILKFKGDEQKSKVSPVFYLDDICNDYYSHKSSIKSIVKYMIDNIENANINVDDLFENVKENIVFHMINKENNKKLLENCPYTQFLNFALIYRIDKGYGFINITYDNLKAFGLEESELFSLAFENTYRLNTPICLSMSEVLSDIIGDELDDKLDIWVFTNDNKLYGATSMIYKEIFLELANKLDSDLIILPSSVHEVLAIPYTTDIDRVADMVYQINKTEVIRDCLLSNQIYLFSRDTAGFTILTDRNELFD